MTEQAYLDWNATAQLRPEAREAVLAALDDRREPVLGAWRRTGRAPAGRAGARAGRGAGRGEAARGRFHLRRHRGQRAGAQRQRSGDRCCWFRRSSIRRCAPAAGSRRSRKFRSRPMAWSISTALRAPPCGRVAAAGLDHARQQRNRRRAAGRARRPRSCMRLAACCMSMRCRGRAVLPAISRRSAPT